MEFSKKLIFLNKFFFLAKCWLSFDPQAKDSNIQTVTVGATKWMRRRNFFIEKCKDAQSIGIVVGTLTAKGYLELVKHIQVLARSRGVRTYLISVGKVNPAKLANFIEIDCFVLVGCPENNLFTSRDFYKPLLSVFEIEMALNPAWHNQLTENYCMDFKELLPSGQLYRNHEGYENIESDVSLVTGQIRMGKADLNDEQKIIDGTVQLKNDTRIMLSDSGSSFQSRSWTGLDPALGKTEPAVLENGRSGLSVMYASEIEEKRE